MLRVFEPCASCDSTIAYFPAKSRDAAHLVCIRPTRRRYSLPVMNLCRNVSLALMLGFGVCSAQLWPGWGNGSGESGPGHYVRIEGGLVVNEDTIQTARETASHSTGTPNWTNSPGFENDVFTLHAAQRR